MRGKLDLTTGNVLHKSYKVECINSIVVIYVCVECRNCLSGDAPHKTDYVLSVDFAVTVDIACLKGRDAALGNC